MLGCWARDHTWNNKASDLSGAARNACLPTWAGLPVFHGAVPLFIKIHRWFA